MSPTKILSGRDACHGPTGVLVGGQSPAVSGDTLVDGILFFLSFFSFFLSFFESDHGDP